MSLLTSKASPQAGCPIHAVSSHDWAVEPQTSEAPNPCLYQEKLHKMPKFTPVFALAPRISNNISYK